MKFHKLSYHLILKLFFTFGAFIYIFIKLNKTFTSFNEINASFNITAKEVFLFTIVLILMTLNWLLESIKWKKLLIKVEEINLSKSIKSVLIGITCSLFTPYRLGEYYGRPMMISKQKKTSSVLANILGSICQNIITMGLGLIGFSLLLLNTKQKVSWGNSLLVFTIITILIALLIFTLINSGKFAKYLNKIKIIRKLKLNPEFLYSYEKKQLSAFLGLSFFRYSIFFTQYFLLLIAFGVNIHVIDAFIAISLSYIFLFSIPSLPIADIAVRGSLALFFLGMFSSNQFSILYASTTLWFINLALPAIIGSYFLINAPKT